MYNYYNQKPIRVFHMLTLIIKQAHTNWDIFANEEGKLFSIAREGSGAENSHFGDKSHLLRLMNSKFFNFNNSEFTEAGLKLISGLYLHFIYNEDGSRKFSYHQFSK